MGKPTFHLVVPFSRLWTQKFWLEFLAPLGVIWHPLTEKPYDWPVFEWVQPFVYTRTPTSNIAMFVINQFLNAVTLIDNDFYLISSDDDTFEPFLFKKLEGISTKFIVVSCKRGDHPVGIYGTSTLVAAPNHMAVGQVTGSQLMLRGSIFKTTRLPLTPAIADGLYIEGIWHTHAPEDFTFVPDTYFYFNYFEPGRWDEFTTRFDEAYYLEQHPDVAAAVKAGSCISGFKHHCQWGRTENRPWRLKPLAVG